MLSDSPVRVLCFADKIIWKGYSAAEASWEPTMNVGRALIAEYEEALRAARTGDKRAEEWVLGLLESFAYEGAAQQERAAERSQQQR